MACMVSVLTCLPFFVMGLFLKSKFYVIKHCQVEKLHLERSCSNYGVYTICIKQWQRRSPVEEVGGDHLSNIIFHKCHTFVHVLVIYEVYK